VTPREKRVITGGAVAAVLILLIGIGPRLFGGGDGEGGAALQAERVARFRGLVASRDTLRTLSRSAAAAERIAAGRYLGGNTPQVAAARLSSVVQAIAEDAEVEVVRESILPPAPAGPATATSLQIVARGDATGLMELLKGVEESPVLLRVDDLTVGGDPREGAGTPSLTISLRVTGYLLRPADDEEAS